MTAEQVCEKHDRLFNIQQRDGQWLAFAVPRSGFIYEWIVVKAPTEASARAGLVAALSKLPTKNKKKCQNIKNG